MLQFPYICLTAGGRVFTREWVPAVRESASGIGSEYCFCHRSASSRPETPGGEGVPERLPAVCPLALHRRSAGRQPAARANQRGGSRISTRHAGGSFGSSTGARAASTPWMHSPRLVAVRFSYRSHQNVCLPQRPPGPWLGAPRLRLLLGTRNPCGAGTGVPGRTFGGRLVWGFECYSAAWSPSAAAFRRPNRLGQS